MKKEVDCMFINNLIFIGLCYLSGSMVFAVILSKFFFDKDVRNFGSGNAGTANMKRLFGWKAAIAVLVCDTLKAYVPMYLAIKRWNIDPIWISIGALIVILGHAKPVFFCFRGGKGVACSLGIMAAIDWRIALTGFTCYIIVLIWTKKSSLGSLLGTLIAVLIYQFIGTNIVFKYFLFILLGVITLLHKDNIKRIIEGKEKTAV